MLKVNPWIASRYMMDRTICRQSASDPFKFRLKNCHLCDNDKYAVSFNASSQFLKHFCCSANTPFLTFVKQDMGLNTWREVIRMLSNYGEAKMLWEMESMPQGTTRVDLLKARLMDLAKQEERVSSGIDLTHWSNDWTTVPGRRIFFYARKRNVPDWFMQSGRVGYFSKGPLYGRLCFLVIEDDKPVYVVGRGVHEGSIPKYLCPTPQAAGGIISGDVVFNLDLVKPGGLCVINEGCLSALSSGEGGVAILGKVLSITQARKIARANPGAVIHLREHGVPRTQVADNCKLLSQYGLYVMTADLVSGDPNDNPEQMEQVKNSALEVDSTTRMLAMLQDIE